MNKYEKDDNADLLVDAHFIDLGNDNNNNNNNNNDNDLFFNDLDEDIL